MVVVVLELVDLEVVLLTDQVTVVKEEIMVDLVDLLKVEEMVVLEEMVIEVV
tara:strand:+ start:81 stop:236 length:156 start_codon:yes stop_codon:yes gene_type:complete